MAPPLGFPIQEGSLEEDFVATDLLQVDHVVVGTQGSQPTQLTKALGRSLRKQASRVPAETAHPRVRKAVSVEQRVKDTGPGQSRQSQG